MKKVLIRANTSNRRRRSITAAENNEDTRVADTIDILKDDFNFAIDSFDKMARSGQVNEALEIMSQLSQSLNEAIQDAAQSITE